MTKLVRLLAALALMLCGITAARASTETVIATMKGRQATQWRRTIVDLNLVGSYYDDPANAPIWVDGGKPTAASSELLEAISRADEDGLVVDDYLSGPIVDTKRLVQR